MSGRRFGEALAIVAIIILVAAGGKTLLLALGHMKVVGALICAGALIAALSAARRAYDPTDAAARSNVTRFIAYATAATFALWSVLAPAAWNFGVTIAAAEIALVFDLMASFARGRAAGGH